MSLSISNTGLALIKQFEGCKLTAYKDSVGVWTIGYGHTSGVTEGMTITQTQADTYLKSDCATAEKAVNSYDSTYGWNQNQFDALVSFTFNCGSGNLKTLLNSGKRTIAEISAKITAYNKAGGVVLAGLTKRRAAEKALFDTATGTSASATVTAASASTSASGYTGTFPALPPRGYYQQGDGITTLTNYKTQIKRVQQLVNWINGGAISVDGQYGVNTVAAVKTAQTALGVTADGAFGSKTLAAAKTYKK